MSVIIKGMELPTSCMKCDLMDDEARRPYCHGLMDYLSEDNIKTKRQSNCPLIEIQVPHGRLIDADKLYEETCKLEAVAMDQVKKYLSDEDWDDPDTLHEWKKWSVILQERGAFRLDLERAETIMEAEDD